MKKRIYGIVVFLAAISLFFGSCEQNTSGASGAGKTGTTNTPTPVTYKVTIDKGTGVSNSDYAVYKSDQETKITELEKVEAGNIYVKALVDNIKVNGKAVAKAAFSEAIKIDDDTTIKIEKDTTSGTSPDDNFIIKDGVLTGYNGDKPSGVVTIPDGVTTIGEEAFSKCSEITKVILPEGLETIGKDAFDECHEIESVVFPKSLTTIGYAAFFGTPKLKEVDLSNTQLKSIGKSAFCGGHDKGLEKITFPETLEEIGELAFKFTNLKEVDLSKTKVKKISLQAFLKCEKLEKVILPSCLETIEKDGFSGCSTLTNINLGNTQVTSIGPTAFENTKLAEVDLSQLNITFGDEVFNGAILGTVIFPESLANGEELKKLVGFEDGILKACGGIKIIDLSKTNLTSIADETFIGGKGLEEVKFPSTLKTIGKKAFNRCQNLSILDLSTTELETIGEESFSESSLRTIKFPHTLNKIEVSAFYYSLLEVVEFMDDDGYSGWKATDPEDSSSVVNIDDKIKELTKEEKSKKFAKLLKNDSWDTPAGYPDCTWTKN